MSRVSDELWADLAKADAAGDTALAQRIAAKIREVESRGVADYVLNAGEELLAAPVGLGSLALQGGAAALDYIAPGSAVADYVGRSSDVLSDFTADRRQARRDFREGDDIGSVTGTIAEIASYFGGGGARAAAQGASRLQKLKQAAQETGRDALDAGTRTLGREESFDAAMADAALTGGVGAGLRGATGAYRAVRDMQPLRAAAQRGFRQDAAQRAAEEAAERQGARLRGEDVIGNRLVRNTARVYGDTIDAVTGSTEKLLAEQRDKFLEAAGAGSGRAMELPFEERVARGFETRYNAVQRIKRDKYKAAEDQIDPLLGKLTITSPGATGKVLAQRLQGVIQQTAEELGMDHPAIKEIVRWGNQQPANFSVWAKRRRALARTMRQARQSGDYNAAEAYSNLLRQIDDQLDDWAGANNLWRQANDFYKREVLPYEKDKALKKIAEDQRRDPAAKLRGDEPAKKILQRNDPADTEIESLLRGLSVSDELRPLLNAEETLELAGKEQDLYRAMIQKVFRSATRNGEGVEIPFSPAAAATELQNLERRIGRLQPDKAQALADWRKIFRATGAAGADAARANTGRSIAQMAAPLALIGGAYGASSGSPGIAATLLAPAALTLLVRSPRFRALMRKTADMDEKHPDYDLMIDRLTSEISKLAAGAN